jgi:2-polyprenyl-6-methoxyphenol hydroxylase-like FAD-dependent oxidoreductase
MTTAARGATEGDGAGGDPRRALVVGGGIGGLAAAIALRRAGWAADVVERARELGEVGAGIALWANGLAALERLGLGERVRALAMPEGIAGIRLPDGERLFDTASEALRARHGTLVVVLHRAELHGALLDALGRDRVRTGATCVGFAQDASGVTARFADGTTERAALLVGADGLHSVVRAQLHGDGAPRYAGYTSWRGVTRIDAGRVVPAETWGRGARFGMTPLADGRVYWFATKDAPPGARSPDGERAELLRTFGGWHEPIRALIEATPDDAILRHDIADRPPLGRWGEGRVTLLGDAAHPMTPNLGQGACQALEDAVALGRALAAGYPLAGGPDVARALRAYERARLPRANAFVRRSRAAGEMGQWRHPVAVAVRTFLGRHLFPRLQGRLLADVLATT